MVDSETGEITQIQDAARVDALVFDACSKPADDARLVLRVVLDRTPTFDQAAHKIWTWEEPQRLAFGARDEGGVLAHELPAYADLGLLCLRCRDERHIQRRLRDFHDGGRA